MSWHAPTTMQEISFSISAGWSWNSKRHQLFGKRIAVLSAHLGLNLDRTDKFSNAVAESAERYSARYLAESTRTPEPDTYMYFVATDIGKVFMAITASGEIQWATGLHKKEYARQSSMAAAAEELAKTFAKRDEWV